MEGTKNLGEVVDGLFALATVLVVQFKDGVTVADFPAVLAKIESSPELKAQLVAAYEDVDKVPAEVKDLSVLETAQIIGKVIEKVPALIAALQAKA